MMRALLGEKCHLARHPCGHGRLVSLQLQCQVLSFLLYSSQSMLKQVVQARKHSNRDAEAGQHRRSGGWKKEMFLIPGQTETLRLKTIPVQTVMETQLVWVWRLVYVGYWKWMDGCLVSWSHSFQDKCSEKTHTQKPTYTPGSLSTKCIA